MPGPTDPETISRLRNMLPGVGIIALTLLEGNAYRQAAMGSSAMGDLAGPGPDAATGAGLVNAKWANILTVGSIAAQFFEASPEQQAAMVASGQVPRVTREFVADLLDTLRSR